jgi:hypothetical protein
MVTGDPLQSGTRTVALEWQLEQFGVAAERVGDDALDRDDLAVALGPQIEDLGDQADEEQEAGGRSRSIRRTVSSVLPRGPREASAGWRSAALVAS